MSAPRPAEAGRPPRGSRKVAEPHFLVSPASATSSAPIRLTLCVDDFGLHEGINGAVARLAEAGRVNAVSCMVGGAAWRSGVPFLRELNTREVDVGLHLDFTEAPLREGSRSGLSALIVRAYARALSPLRVRSEIDAQLDAFDHGLYRPPDYVDGHQHVHQLPVIRRALIEALHSRYATHRPWLRSTRPGNRTAGLKPRIIATLGDRAMRSLARAGGHPQNRHLLGAYGFDADAAGYRQRLAQWLGQAVDGDVLMCHPSLPGVAHDPILQARVNEFIVLAEAGLDQALQQAGVKTARLPRDLPPS